MDDNALRYLFQRYISKKASLNRSNCPSPHSIFRSYNFFVPRWRKKRIVDHISNCRNCASEFSLFLEIRRFEYFLFRTEEKSFPRKFSWLGFINIQNHIFFSLRIVFILAGLAFIIYSISDIALKKDSADLLRSKGTNIVLIYPTHTHTLPKPLVFSWQKQNRAQYYIIDVYDDVLLPVWTSSKIYSTRFQLPEFFITHLNIGNSYYWMVTAFSNSEQIKESRLTRFKVLGKQ